MQTEPQLSAEMEAKFEKMWTEGTGLHDRAKHFLATALEEQRIQIYREIEDDFRLRILDIQKGSHE